MIQAMNSSENPSEPEYVGMSEVEEALRQAERTGTPIYDGLEDIEYDADSIRAFLGQSDGSGI
jgi:hypothetical protein